MTGVVHPAVEHARADVAAALAGVDWQARAEAAEAALEAAEARLAAIAAHCRLRMSLPGRSGMSLAAAGLILGLAEGSSEKEQS